MRAPWKQGGASGSQRGPAGAGGCRQGPAGASGNREGKACGQHLTNLYDGMGAASMLRGQLPKAPPPKLPRAIPLPLARPMQPRNSAPEPPMLAMMALRCAQK